MAHVIVQVNGRPYTMQCPEGEEAQGWSEYHRTLGRYLFQPARTPAAPLDTAGKTAPKQAKKAMKPETSQLGLPL